MLVGERSNLVFVIAKLARRTFVIKEKVGECVK